jgi:hypothetical protein
MVNLTVLAPDIVEAILDDNVPPELTLFDLAVDPPRLWKTPVVMVLARYPTVWAHERCHQVK